MNNYWFVSENPSEFIEHWVVSLIRAVFETSEQQAIILLFHMHQYIQDKGDLQVSVL